MTARVTISLPEDLLARLDAEAEARGEARSVVAQEAMATYLGQTAEQRERVARRTSIEAAIAGMRAMAAGNPVRDGRPTLEMLREIRGTDDSSPLRHREEEGDE